MSECGKHSINDNFCCCVYNYYNDFLSCDSSYVSNLTHRQELKIQRVFLELLEFFIFFIDIFPPSAWTGDSSPLPLEVQSFPPTLCWWQDFNNSSVFGLHCAGGPVRPSSSVASEEPSTNQDEQDFLWLFDLLKLQAQEGKNGWGDKEWLWLLWSYFVFL